MRGRLQHCIRLISVLTLLLSTWHAQASAMTPEHISMTICGLDAHQIVLLDVSVPASSELEKHDCCGDCIGFDTLRTPDMQFAARFVAIHPVQMSAPTYLHYPGAPTWPGAPPQGPPAACL